MTPSQTTMRIRAAAMDVTITSDGPDAGSAEVSAVLAQLRRMIAGVAHDPDILVGPSRNRAERRADAARRRRQA